MFIGKRANVVAALVNNSENLNGESKVEYDDVLPHLVGIVNQNFSDPDFPIVQITASGHGYSVNGKPVQRECVCNINLLYGTLV